MKFRPGGYEMKSDATAREVTETLLQIYGTQAKVAAALGVSQPAVSRWLVEDTAVMEQSTRLLAARLVDDFVKAQTEEA